MTDELINDIDYYYNFANRLTTSDKSRDLVHICLLKFKNKRNLKGLALKSYFTKCILNEFRTPNNEFNQLYPFFVPLETDLTQPLEIKDDLCTFDNLHLEEMEILEEYYTSGKRKAAIAKANKMSRKGYYYKYVKPILNKIDEP
jgi:gamma-glutamylcyclotransferase (GGCT)/AIG2-like uncharacterized protein YtfP